jgi:hypothetical protein
MYYNAFGHLKTQPVKPKQQPQQKIAPKQYEQFIKLRASALAGRA